MFLLLRLHLSSAVDFFLPALPLSFSLFSLSVCAPYLYLLVILPFSFVPRPNRYGVSPTCILYNKRVCVYRFTFHPIGRTKFNNKIHKMCLVQDMKMDDEHAPGLLSIFLLNDSVLFFLSACFRLFAVLLLLPVYISRTAYTHTNKLYILFASHYRRLPPSFCVLFGALDI